MYINAVRYRIAPSDAWQTYKFVGGSGALRYFSAVVAEEKIANDLLAAIEFTLTGKGRTDYQIEAALQISDVNGDSWILHRNGGNFRVSCNGKTLTPEEVKTSLISVFYELDAHFDGFSQLVQTRATVKNGKLVSSRTPDPKNSLVAEAAATHQVLAANILEADAANVTTALLPLLRNQVIKSQTVQNLQATIPDDLDQAQYEFDALKTELTRADAVRQLAEPMLEPGANPKRLSDSLEAVESEIAEISAACGIDASKPNRIPSDLKVALTCLTRLEMYERLIRAADEVRKGTEKILVPRLNAYLEVIERHSLADSGIIAELESCAQSLLVSGSSEPSTMSGATDNKEWHWFDRFKGRPAKETTAPHMTLDATMATIRHLLEKIRDLNSGVEATRQSHDAAIARLDATSETFVREFSRLKQNWSEIATALKLPANISLKQLVELLNRQSDLQNLWRKREQLISALSAWDARIEKLRQQLKLYRDATKSARTADLEDPMICMSEARDVIRYADAKKEKFERLKVRAEERSQYKLLRRQVGLAKQDLEAGWQELTIAIGKPVPRDLAKLQECYQHLAAAEALTRQAPVVQEDNPMEELRNHPVPALWLAPEAAENAQLRIALEAAAKDKNCPEFLLVVATNENLRAAFREMGMRMLVHVPPQKSQTETANARAKQEKAAENSRDSRVQRVLGVLATKRSPAL